MLKLILYIGCYIMYPIIFPIYGPIALHTYSACIGAGIIIFVWRMHQHPLRKAIISSDDLISVVVQSAIGGILGARLLHVISEWKHYDHICQIFYLWNGGLSLLGGVIAVIIYALWFLHSNKISIIPVLDLSALYAPLMISIARLGCFFAGCCHGITTAAPWAIKYTNPQCIAPLNIYIHPTQIYSSLFFLSAFIIVKHRENKLRIPGQKILTCLMLIGFERFCVDFFRGDRIFINSYFSFHQNIALAIFTLSALLFIKITYFSPQQKALRS